MTDALTSPILPAPSGVQDIALADQRGRPVSLLSEDGQRLDYIAYVPRSAGPDAPVLVCVHGLRRNPAEQIFRLSAQAESAGVILMAPHFSRRKFRYFQSLTPGEAGERPEELFDAALDDCIARCGLSNPAIWLFGFSGGGQFAHRYAMLGRRKLDRLVLAAPGWFTMPDRDAPFPYGIGSGEFLDARNLDPALLLQTPSLVIVGSADTSRGPSLNTDPRIDSVQGRNRLARAHHWIGRMQALAGELKRPCPWEIITLDGAKHGFSRNVGEYGLGAALFNWLTRQS